MSIEKKSGTVDTVTRIVAPVAESLGLQLWDVRYEKEGESWYLRIFIDKPGGVNINDCENLSRAVDGPIDEADPIRESYYLEVSSPGIERDLLRPEHFNAYLGQLVAVRLIRPLDGVRDFVGTLRAYQDGTATLELADGHMVPIEKKQAAYIRVYEDYEAGGVDKK